MTQNKNNLGNALFELGTRSGGEASSWQNKVLHAFAVGFVLLALIGGSVWWCRLSLSLASRASIEVFPSPRSIAIIWPQDQGHRMKVFLSHSTKDKQFVQSLADELQREQYRWG